MRHGKWGLEPPGVWRDGGGQRVMKCRNDRAQDGSNFKLTSYTFQGNKHMHTKSHELLSSRVLCVLGDHGCDDDAAFV